MSDLIFTITDRNVTVFLDGAPRTFPSSHGSFADIRAAVLAGDEAKVRELTDVKAHIAKVTMGRVKIYDEEITVDGRVVAGRLVDRILEMVRLGSEAIGGYVKFLDRLLDNPRKMAVDELYLFIEACDLPITPDGCFLAYRFVNTDYLDGYSRSVFAKPADRMTADELATYSKPVVGGRLDEVVTQVVDGFTTVHMPRNMVNDDRDQTCSDGLHFCSYDYLPSYGVGFGQTKRVLVVKIDPADVVSIPSDYNNSKGRTWKYRVVNEIENWADTRITPWYTDEYEDGDDVDDEDYDDLNDLDPIMDADPLDYSYEPDADRDYDGDYSQKLTWQEVRDMRQLFAEGELTLTQIAEMYGISRRQAARIRDGESWIES